MLKNGRPNGGFTLLELLVVMVIIAMVAGFGIPLFAKSIERAEVKTAAGKIVAVMRLARGEAIATRQPVTAIIDAENRRVYAIRGKYDPMENPPPLYAPETIPPSVKIWTLGENTEAVEFNPSGAATSCSVSLTQETSLAGNDAAGYHIAVDPLSGRARVIPNNTTFGKNENRE